MSESAAVILCAVACTFAVRWLGYASDWGFNALGARFRPTSSSPESGARFASRIGVFLIAAVVWGVLFFGSLALLYSISLSFQG